MKKLTRYKEIESFLFSQLPMFQRIGPKAFKKDLGNIEFLLNRLNHPELQLNCIHIAGTNGKGSTSFLLATALQEQGFSVGLYTSPHYRDFRERIRVNAEMIDKTFVKNFINALIENGIFESGFKPSFFEVSVAMAFMYFKERHVDYAIIETGLGGRLDSTNVITPITSIITNIGLDHTAFLGNTLEKIAIEKAGIIKTNVPVIIGKTQKETEAIFINKAIEHNSTITFSDQLQCNSTVDSIAQDFPEYQRENLYTAYNTLKSLFPKIKWEPLLLNAWIKGLSRWGFVGRYTILSESPKIIADSAHNKEGMVELFKQIDNEAFNKFHIVMAMVNDKNLESVLNLFPTDATYYFSNAKIPRALDKLQLSDQAKAYNLYGKTYISVNKALAAAKKKAKIEDLILITGSIFTVAEII